jgi:hypothetical protein
MFDKYAGAADLLDDRGLQVTINVTLSTGDRTWGGGFSAPADATADLQAMMSAGEALTLQLGDGRQARALLQRLSPGSSTGGPNGVLIGTGSPPS